MLLLRPQKKSSPASDCNFETTCKYRQDLLDLQPGNVCFELNKNV